MWNRSGKRSVERTTLSLSISYSFVRRRTRFATLFFILHEISFFIALQLTAIIVCIALFDPFGSLAFTLPCVFVFGPVFVVVRIFIRHFLPGNRFIEYMANKCTMHTNNGAGTYTCTPSTATPFAIKAIFMRLANLLAINFPSHCGRLVNINNVSNDERHTPRVTNGCRI